MSMFGAERSDAATPGMLFMSASLHVLVIFLVCMASLSSPHRSLTQREGVARVSLVEEPSPNPVAQTIARGPVRMQQPEVSEPLAQQELPAVALDAERKVIAYKTANQTDAAVIPLKKRKAAPRRIENSKPEPPKKQETKTAEKKDDPKDFLERRLARIRSEVEKKKKEQPAVRESTGLASGQRGGAARGPVLSEDFVRWFEDVRGRINAHWSLIGDNRKREKFAVIGVKLSEDGRLLEATVDETSGDPLFDKSAMRAVFLASPFPPMPVEIREKIKQAGGLALRFSPGGIQ
ncbi:MAG: TonB family protein [Desulfomonilaceae bacterium]